MKVDVLLQEVTVLENGTLFKTCSGLVILNWIPPDGVQAVNPGGRKLELRDNNTMTITDNYQQQFELRATVTGKSWIKAHIISMRDPGIIGDLISDLIELVKKPLPIGASVLDKISDKVKKGMPQVIASGISDTFTSNDIPKTDKIDLTAPKKVIVEIPKPYPEEGPPDRKVLLKENSPNGTIVIKVVEA